jgi:hypothetical protein
MTEPCLYVLHDIRFNTLSYWSGIMAALLGVWFAPSCVAVHQGDRYGNVDGRFRDLGGRL